MEPVCNNVEWTRYGYHDIFADVVSYEEDGKFFLETHNSKFEVSELIDLDDLMCNENAEWFYHDAPFEGYIKEELA